MAGSKLWMRLLADRWQLPLAVVALGVAILAIPRLGVEPPPTPIDVLIADIVALRDAGRYRDAIDSAANLLEMDPPPTTREAAQLHDLLADALLMQESLRETPIARNVQRLLEHHDHALLKGAPLTSHVALRAARSYEWQGRRDPAVREYRAALQRAPTDQQRLTALSALVRLLKDDGDYVTDRRGFLNELLLEDGLEPALTWDSAREALQDAIDRDELERARRLLETVGLRLQRSDLRGYHDFLQAWLAVAQGRHEQARAYLDAVNEWWTAAPHNDLQLERTAYLPAYAAWLRGRIELAEERPQTALGWFERAQSLQSFGEALVLNTLGSADALARMERHATARETLLTALRNISSRHLPMSYGLPRLLDGLVRLAAERHRDSDYQAAIDYLELALEYTPEAQSSLRLDMLEQLGVVYELAADAIHDERRAALLVRAAESNEAAAALAGFEPQRYASLLWRAAGQYDQGGVQAASTRVLSAFVANREDDPRLPQAMLRLGQSYAAGGRPLEAIGWYDELIGLFPRLTEGALGRLNKAEALMWMGEKHYPAAERELLSLVDGELVSPSAPVYRDALHALIDLYHETSLYAEAISRIEDFLNLYPRDADVSLMRYLLADAFRRSATALRDADGNEAEREAARQESRRRWTQAAALYGTFLTEAPADTDDPTASLRRRLALMYRADCHYELNDAESLREALTTYHQVAAEYREYPTSLSAHVRIADIHLRQGQLREAGSALERARWQLAALTDESFESEPGQSRESWESLLATAAAAPLLNDPR